MRIVEVDLTRCIRCGGCSTVAPTVFSVAGKATAIDKQPATDVEWHQARVARLVCPTQAISIAEAS